MSVARAKVHTRATAFGLPVLPSTPPKSKRGLSTEVVSSAKAVVAREAGEQLALFPSDPVDALADGDKPDASPPDEAPEPEPAPDTPVAFDPTGDHA